MLCVNEVNATAERLYASQGSCGSGRNRARCSSMGGSDEHHMVKTLG